MSKWKPIEIIGDDWEGPVLGYIPSLENAPAWCPIAVIEPSDSETGWDWSHDTEGISGDMCRPTHYMLLPPSPETAPTEERES